MSKQLSKREIDVMKILWASDKPLSSLEVSLHNTKLSKNTIQAVLKSLLNDGFIEVSDIAYSGTVLTRCYRPIVSMAEYVRDNFLFDSTLQVISSFISEEKNNEVLLELEDLIKQKIKDINK